MSSEPSLAWPNHFPPRDRWKKFFIGVRGLGPDLSFFKTLQAMQGQRTRAVMQAWPDWPSKRMAFLLGTVLRIHVGWKKPYFVPSDRFMAAAYGPEFHDLYEWRFEGATSALEKHLHVELSEEFWNGALNLNFGEVVQRLLARTQREAAPSNSG